MLEFGPLAFLNPWLLGALALLPILWLLLRATPPSPARVSFPGVRLLLGLEDPEKTPHRTPWWLLLLRMMIAGAIILAFAEPVLNPREGAAGNGPVVLVMDGGWASAPDWEARRDAALAELDRAERADRPVSFHVLADPVPPDLRLRPRPAGEWRGMVEALQPRPWAPLRAEWAEAFAALRAASDEEGAREIAWLTDGLDHGDEGALVAALDGLGALRILAPTQTARALAQPRLVEGRLMISAMRAEAGPAETLRVAVFGKAPSGEAGAERRLANLDATIEEGEQVADAELDLPLELRNQIARVALLGEESAGAVALTDESQRRRRVGLSAGGSEAESLRLVSSLHYLRTALARNAEVVEGTVEQLLDANPDAVFLADIGRLTPPEREGLEAFVRAGGLLVRFAGPRLARGSDLAGAGPGAEDPLLPVPLRAGGGRAVGGAMAWGAPQAVREFGRESPFFGLTAPREVTVSRQILAEIGPGLAERTWATLEDGTPLVTAAPLGDGRVVLFHVGANAEWSSLPLSGLFVEMLRRLVSLGSGGTGEAPEGEAPMRLVAAIDGFGRAAAAPGDLPAVPAQRLADAPGPDAPPGLWAGETARIAVNLFPAAAPPALAPPYPLSASVETFGGRTERPLAHWLLGLALLLFAVDLLAALRLSGRRIRFNPGAAAILLALALAWPGGADAQDARSRDVIAANETVLGYVKTGDAALDAMSEAGLRGLSRVLAARTAVEPAEPMGVDLETDDLAFFPILYWPVGAAQPTPSDEASARLNAYMRAGGMIIFDTRDAHLARPGSSAGPNGQALRRLVAALDLPPLTPVPADHVLTRTFYLLDRFPGRWTGGEVWVQAPAPRPEGETAEGEPPLISDPNDGVSPVVIGAADWAAAWAVDQNGEFLAPVGRSDDYRQRETAFRFGVNVVMYALTGNYKSDQVHVPALLERLGN